MGIPQYAKMIKEPMDMSTMKKKLDNREYPNAEKFYEDFNLMIRNCMKFNPIGNLVHQAGVDLQRLFEEKWESLPPLKATVSEDEDEDEEEDSEDERRSRSSICSFIWLKFICNRDNCTYGIAN